MPTPRLLLAALTLLAAAPFTAHGQDIPGNGTTVLERMRARYATTWYPTLEFSQANSNGNFFLPLIEGVYLQPVERTIKDLASTDVDFDKTHVAEWNATKVSMFTDWKSRQIEEYCDWKSRHSLDPKLFGGPASAP